MPHKRLSRALINKCPDGAFEAVEREIDGIGPEPQSIFAQVAALVEDREQHQTGAQILIKLGFSVAVSAEHRSLLFASPLDHQHAGRDELVFVKAAERVAK